MKLFETFFQNHDYRPDVDGLRALAVIVVVLFHAWPKHFGFGIFGVDIFFVISGYLITSIIIKDLDKGRFSFKKFYHRRILRIIPPLLTILCFCLIAGFFFLTAEEYSRLGANARAGAFFWGNFFLMAEAGYFDVASSLKPFLHLWSLGIEEQFYIIYPLLLLLTAKYSAKLFLVALLGGISLLFGPQISAWLFGPAAGDAIRYYSPLSRAFDLCAGALLALILRKRQIKPKYGTISAITGSTLIIISCFVIDSAKPWPSLYTLLPVAGIILLILAGPHNWLSRILLANKPVVLIGLISYELYLWHWPLLSFANILAGGPEHVPSYAKILLLFLALILSFLLFYFFGLPLRRKYRKNGKIGLILLALLVVVGLGGHFVMLKKGLPARIDQASALKGWEAPGINADVARAAPFFPDWKNYTDAPNQAALEAPPHQTDLAIIGDSHAQQLYAGLKDLLDEKNIAVFPASGQAPYLGVATLTENMSNYRKNGFHLIDQAFNTVINNPRIKTVILAHNPECSIGDAIDLAKPEDKDINAIMERAMRKTLRALQKANKKVILVLDNPALNFDPASLAQRPINFSNQANNRVISRKDAEANPARIWYNALCKKMAAEFDNVKLIDLFDAFCDADYCRATIDGKPLYWDRTHLTNFGSHIAAQFLIKAF